MDDQVSTTQEAAFNLARQNSTMAAESLNIDPWQQEDGKVFPVYLGGRRNVASGIWLAETASNDLLEQNQNHFIGNKSCLTTPLPL